MDVRPWRVARWGGRALLLAALLLGIVTMHTLGHPSPDSGTSAPPSHAAPLSAAPSGEHGGGHGDSGRHDTGMDPMSVCLAVLGVWSAAVLLGVAVLLVVRHRRAVDFLAAVRARILLALRPLPPPPTADRLAALSVLRI
ncbi:hypothetical protein GCM10009801_49300 [Streptomyces albiaxialis]|uniref:Uncharacterized protein n=1 Tax=Streptomyces albiaxialis TaxID=329523 RepID=A0ABN2W9E7_9ACTN